MVQDLSTLHGLAGDLFSLPDSPEGWERFRLSDDQVAFYRREGFLPGLQVLSDDQVEVLREELQGLFDPDHLGHELFYEYHSNESTTSETVLFHALGAWRIAPGLHDILWNPAFTMPASQLLEGPVRFWHDQLFCKPPHHGGVVAWHQDYSYWTRTRPMAHLTCWIALDDADEENGCLHYVPGSHEWPLLPITGLAGNMDEIRTVLTPDQEAQFDRRVAVPLRKGECTFHHPLMVHGSFENRSDRPRRGVVINVLRDGVKSATDAPLLKGVPPVPEGQPMGGQFFPLLFDPSALSLWERGRG